MRPMVRMSLLSILLASGALIGDGCRRHRHAALVAFVHVHVVQSSEMVLDGAGVFDDDEDLIRDHLEDKFKAMNEIFEQVCIQWEIDSIVLEPSRADEDYGQAGTVGARSAALKRALDLSDLFQPRGGVMFVVRKTSGAGYGGQFMCGYVNDSPPVDWSEMHFPFAEGEHRPGVVVVPLHAANGSPQAVRKWAHEVGHAMACGTPNANGHSLTT